MEKLYNNILLDPETMKAPSDPDAVPYLQNPPAVIDVSVGRQLFVDDFLIEKTDLTPTFHKAVKYTGNPILKPETDLECHPSPVAAPKSGGVWYDEEAGIFRMWYEAGWLTNMCYAESSDGINWVRPDLGDGTNRILGYDGYEIEKCAGDLTYLRPDSTAVIWDPTSKDQRWKLFLRNPGGQYPGIAATSADGIHFENFRFTTPLFDRSTIFYNPFRKKWVYSIREGWPTRCRRYRECDDYLAGAAWSEEEAPLWLAADDRDLPNPYIGFKPQLYNVDAIGYESLMLGMFQIMLGPENPVCEAAGVPKITELQLMFSRDGYHFSRPFRQPIINASLHAGSWDRGYVQSTAGGVVIHGDELWIYYIGFAADESHAGESWFTNGIYRNGATGLAKLRRDGFVSMNGRGTLLTRPLTFDGKASFHINAKGNVRAAMIDMDGRLLGVGGLRGDSTNARLFDVAAFNGRTVRIHFSVDGELYSFGLADENGDFGGAHAAGIVPAVNN